MPIYSFRCPRCGWEEERNVPSEYRDDQVCVEELQGGGTGEDAPLCCGAALVRSEIELTAWTPGKWKT